MRLIFLLSILLFSLLEAKEQFTIYVNQHLSHSRTIKRWQPTIDYLNFKLPAYHFKLLAIKATQLGRIKKLIHQKKIDFLITQPAIYTELEYTHGIQALVTMSNEHHMSKFGSVIISHKQSAIKNLEDVKGKRLSAVAPFGFGGWLIGYNELMENGIDPLKDGHVEFTGSQKKVLEVVLNKQADVGIIRTGMLEKLSKEMNLDNIFIVNEKKCKKAIRRSTRLFPEWAFAVASHVESNLSNYVFDALIHLGHESMAAKMGEYSDWHLPQNYSEVDKLFERLRIGHYKDMPKYSLEDMIYISLLVMLLSLVAIIYSRYQIANMLTHKLQKEIEHKRDELERVNVELSTIFDLNPHITIITDGKHIQRVNRRFLDFLDIKTLSDFSKDYDCICDRFEECEGYLQKEVEGKTWIEYVDQNSHLFHKALIIQNAKEYIFSIHVVNIHYLNHATYIVTLEDITQMDEIASRDKLTSLFNRMKLDEVLNQLITQYPKDLNPFSLAIIDIDNFKKVNDKYGHIIGDKVLSEFSKILRNNSRSGDIVGRWGGEEFMIIYKNTSGKDAYGYMERIRKAVEGFSFVTLERQSISIGIATYGNLNMEVETLLNQADQALYQAKNSGKNQTIIFE